MIRPRTRWRESLSFGVIFFFFPQSPLDPPAVCIQSAQPVRSTAKVMLGCHGHWSSLWLTGHFSSTNLICIWDCHTSTLVSNLPQHTRHSLCWLDTVHRRSPCFLNDWACKSGISVLPPPLPALGDRYPEGVSRSQKPDVLYCQKTVRDELANTCTRLLSMLSAFFDALQLFDF